MKYVLVYMHEIYLWFHVHLQATRQSQMEGLIEKLWKILAWETEM